MYPLLWEYFVNLIEIILFYLFIHLNLQPNNLIINYKRKQILYLIVKYSIVCVLNTFHINEIATMTINSLIGILYVTIFYDGILYLRILWASIFPILTMLSEYVTLSIVKIFIRQNISAALYGGPLRIPLTMVYLSLLAVFVFLSQQFSNKAIFLTTFEKIAYFIISFSGIIIGHYMIGVTLEAENEFHTPHFTYKLVLVTFFFLLLFLSLLIYIYLLGRSKSINNQLKEKEKIHELETLEYKNVLSATKSLREMKHDISIHLNVIHSMVMDCPKEELLEYIEKYCQTLDQAHKFISTGNIAIDCILSSKIDMANNLGIKVDFSIMTPDDFPLDSISTSSLLGNLWNNAIEACQKQLHDMPQSKPYIRFYIKPFKDTVSIHIENSFNGIVHKNFNGEYLSTKNDSDHGIGLSRIRDIVENANGYLHIHSDNQIFLIHITLPIKEKQNENENNYS